MPKHKNVNLKSLFQANCMSLGGRPGSWGWLQYWCWIKSLSSFWILLILQSKVLGPHSLEIKFFILVLSLKKKSTLNYSRKKMLYKINVSDIFLKIKQTKNQVRFWIGLFIRLNLCNCTFVGKYVQFISNFIWFNLCRNTFHSKFYIHKY